MLFLKYQDVESLLEATRETTVCIENIVTVKDSIIVDISEELEEITENMQRKKGTIIYFQFKNNENKLNILSYKQENSSPQDNVEIAHTLQEQLHHYTESIRQTGYLNTFVDDNPIALLQSNRNKSNAFQNFSIFELRTLLSFTSTERSK